jgi:hypothetical protein
MLPENSYDIQPSDGDREGLLIKDQHSIHEKQPRKIGEIPDDVRPPVLTQDTEKQPRKKDDAQPLDVNQQRPPPTEARDGAQLPKVIHHEEPEATIQSPGGKREISEMEGQTPEVGVDVQLSNIVPENPSGVIYEQQPRKKIDNPLDDDQEELESAILSQDDNQETLQTARKLPELARSFQPSALNREGSLIDEQHQNDCPPDVTQKSEPEVLDHVQPADLKLCSALRQPRKRNSKDLDEVQFPDVNQE